MSYTKPIPLEKLPYTPIELGDMLENNEKEREIEVEGYGRGRLVISQQNKNKPFFYADEANIEANQKAAKQLQIAETAFNAPLLLSPVLGLATGIPKIIKSKQKQTIDLAAMKARESNLENSVKLNKTVDDVFQMPQQQVQDIVKIAKRNKISYKQAEEYLNLKLKGIEPTGTLNPGSSVETLRKRFMKSPKDRFPGADDVKAIDLGIGEFGKRKKLTTPEFLTKRFQQYGFRKGPNGNYVLDTKTYNALPTDAAKRDMAQIFQTAEDQTVPGSFNIEQTKQAPEFNAKYADYLRKYKGKPELHHSFPSAMSVRFWLDEEYMGENWQELKAVANEYGNYPGQPMTEGQSNLITVPSKTTKGAPNHLHNIIHNEFFTNEVGQRGQKFFTEERLAKMKDGIDGKIEVFREWNEIVRRNRLLTNEAMSQIEALYSKGTFAENPEKVTSMLEEYLGTGKVKIGQSKVGGKVVDYSQMSVSDTISNALSDFVNDVKLEFLGTDPRFKEVETAIKEFGLSEGEQLQATELLYDIKSYNSIKLSAGARRAQIVTGITKQQHKNNLAAYKNLIQLKLPLDDIPTNSTLESTVFKDTKLPKLEKQLELIFDD